MKRWVAMMILRRSDAMHFLSSQSLWRAPQSTFFSVYTHSPSACSSTQPGYENRIKHCRLYWCLDEDTNEHPRCINRHHNMCMLHWSIPTASTACCPSHAAQSEHVVILMAYLKPGLRKCRFVCHVKSLKEDSNENL
eukprot:scaffold180457_cov42-Prasinocladus_malaysianus.AAC.2